MMSANVVGNVAMQDVGEDESRWAVAFCRGQRQCLLISTRYGPLDGGKMRTDYDSVDLVLNTKSHQRPSLRRDLTSFAFSIYQWRSKCIPVSAREVRGRSPPSRSSPS